MNLNSTTIYALEQNERLQKRVDELEIENRNLILELNEMRKEIVSDKKEMVDFQNKIGKLSSEVSYLANKQRSKDFDWDVGY